MGLHIGVQLLVDQFPGGFQTQTEGEDVLALHEGPQGGNGTGEVSRSPYPRGPLRDYANSICSGEEPRHEAQAERWWHQWIDRQAGLSWSDLRQQVQADAGAATHHEAQAQAALGEAVGWEAAQAEAADRLGQARQDAAALRPQAEAVAEAADREAARPAVTIPAAAVAEQVRAQEQEQRRLVERLEEVHRDHAGHTGQPRRQLQGQAEAEVGGMAWRDHQARQAEAWRKYTQAEAEHEAAEQGFSRYRGVLGTSRIFAHPVAWWRAGGRLKAATERLADAEDALDEVQEQQSLWSRWWQRSDVRDQVQQRTDDLVAEDRAIVAEAGYASAHLAEERQRLKALTERRSALESRSARGKSVTYRGEAYGGASDGPGIRERGRGSQVPVSRMRGLQTGNVAVVARAAAASDTALLPQHACPDTGADRGVQRPGSDRGEGQGDRVDQEQSVEPRPRRGSGMGM